MYGYISFEICFNKKMHFPEPDVVNNFSYAEIKHSDWLNIVIGLGKANQNASFQPCVATTLL